jgi:hypothetical protein
LVCFKMYNDGQQQYGAQPYSTYQPQQRQFNRNYSYPQQQQQPYLQAPAPQNFYGGSRKKYQGNYSVYSSPQYQQQQPQQRQPMMVSSITLDETPPTGVTPPVGWGGTESFTCELRQCKKPNSLNYGSWYWGGTYDNDGMTFFWALNNTDHVPHRPPTYTVDCKCYKCEKEGSPKKGWYYWKNNNGFWYWVDPKREQQQWWNKLTTCEKKPSVMATLNSSSSSSSTTSATPVPMVVVQ